MKKVRRAALAALLLFPAGLHVTAADDAGVCLTPGKLLRVANSTHSLIPYPPQSAHENEQGQTVVKVAIGVDGVPTDVTVTQSSGSQRLDDAVVRHIKEYWRWQPPTEDCKPATAEAPVVVAWHIGRPPKATIGIQMRQSYYPPGAAERMEMGDTYLELSLGDAGVVKDGRVAYSSGFPDLDEKALEVVKTTPGLMADQPTGTEVVLVRWSLSPEQRKYLEIMIVYGFLTSN